MCKRRLWDSSKSQWNQAYPGLPHKVADNTRYIQVCAIIGRKARRYWLSGVRKAGFGTEDLDRDFGAELRCYSAASASGGRISWGLLASTGAGLAEGCFTRNQAA